MSLFASRSVRLAGKPTRSLPGCVAVNPTLTSIHKASMPNVHRPTADPSPPWARLTFSILGLKSFFFSLPQLSRSRDSFSSNFNLRGVRGERVVIMASITNRAAIIGCG